jgi:hypothetical protein
LIAAAECEMHACLGEPIIGAGLTLAAAIAALAGVMIGVFGLVEKNCVRDSFQLRLRDVCAVTSIIFHCWSKVIAFDAVRVPRIVLAWFFMDENLHPSGANGVAL